MTTSALCAYLPRCARYLSPSKIYRTKYLQACSICIVFAVVSICDACCVSVRACACLYEYLPFCFRSDRRCDQRALPLTRHPNTPVGGDPFALRQKYCAHSLRYQTALSALPNCTPCQIALPAVPNYNSCATKAVCHLVFSHRLGLHQPDVQRNYVKQTHSFSSFCCALCQGPSLIENDAWRARFSKQW
jgi:hypothetical protein